MADYELEDQPLSPAMSIIANRMRLQESQPEIFNELQRVYPVSSPEQVITPQQIQAPTDQPAGPSPEDQTKAGLSQLMEDLLKEVKKKPSSIGPALLGEGG